MVVWVWSTLITHIFKMGGGGVVHTGAEGFSGNSDIWRPGEVADKVKGNMRVPGASGKRPVVQVGQWRLPWMWLTYRGQDEKLEGNGSHKYGPLHTQSLSVRVEILIIRNRCAKLLFVSGNRGPGSVWQQNTEQGGFRALGWGHVMSSGQNLQKRL